MRRNRSENGYKTTSGSLLKHEGSAVRKWKMHVTAQTVLKDWPRNKMSKASREEAGPEEKKGKIAAWSL